MKPELYATAVPARGAAVPRTAARVVLDLLALTKPRIGVFVVFAALTGALLAEGPGGGLAPAVGAALLVGAVAASSCVFNQLLERDLDLRMRRTANRPLPAGRLEARDAVLLGAALALVGTLGLAVWYGYLAALLALATLFVYVLVYTPLKRATSLNTVVGAVSGAMPPLLGWVAIAGTPSPWAWTLFAILFLWQFPHFLAIAWLYREDYARAGMRMLPALPGSAGLAGRQAFLHALVLLPVSLLPAARGEAAWTYVVVAVVGGLAYAAAAGAFARRESVSTARATLFASLAYLPLLLTAALLDQALTHSLRI